MFSHPGSISLRIIDVAFHSVDGRLVVIFSPSILIGASHVQLYYKDVVFSCNCCHIWIVTAITQAAPGFSAGINKGSCFRINHFPEDNDYDTDSSEYILRKSLQPPSNTWTLNLSLFSSGGDGPITRVLNVSWHLYPSRIKAWCHDGNWSYRDDDVCCVPMSNRAGLKHDCTHSIVHLTFDREDLSLWKLSKHCGKFIYWSHFARGFRSLCMSLSQVFDALCPIPAVVYIDEFQ